MSQDVKMEVLSAAARFIICGGCICHFNEGIFSHLKVEQRLGRAGKEIWVFVLLQKS